MAGDSHPADTDIKQIFKRLYSNPANKTCFDCGSNNPTWASVTYGVFLCIDCSAVHRSLGVHITFIRSTQLDTQWTWLQLRAMQVGGNANARTFFNNHGCMIADSQKKYHSRAATMYRDKVLSLAQHAHRLHGTKVHIDAHQEAASEKEKEVDFFNEHTSLSSSTTTDFPMADNMRMGSVAAKPQTPSGPVATNGRAIEDPTAAPNVDLALSTSPTQTASIPQPKKAFIGAKKAPAAKKKGFGATRVKKDFNEIESRAQQVDKEREDMAKNIAIQEAKTKEEQEKQMANMRLAYQDMSVQRKKDEEKMARTDPKKAQQLERLGMVGMGSGNRGISHSAISDMQTIQQEAPSNSSSSRRDFDAYGEKPRNNRRDFFDDEFEFVSSKKGGSSWDTYGSSNDDFGGGGGGGWGSKNKGGSWDFDDKPARSQEVSSFSQKSYDNNDDNVEINSEEEEEEVIFDEYGPTYARKAPAETSTPASGDSVQKKYGNAKAISSDQFFGNDKGTDYETKQSLSRLEGSTSISSDDFFGGGSGGGGGRRNNSYGNSQVDMQDIKDGVKQGVTKVAGKMSSLANGLMSSLQSQ